MTTVGVTHRDAASAGFYEGTARGELLIRTCQACGHHAAPPVVYCPACGSARVDWAAAAGRGTIASWSVVHPRSGVGPTEPAVIGVVELEEGPWVLGRIIGPPGRMAAGLPVQVEFVRPDDGEAIPVYRLTESPA